MLKFKNDLELENPILSNRILSFYNTNHKKSSFLNDINNFLIKETNLENPKISLSKLSDVTKSLADFKKNKLVINNIIDYKKISSVLFNLEYRIEYIRLNKASKKRYTEIPLAAYTYRGNNKTKFEKSEKLSSLLYK